LLHPCPLLTSRLLFLRQKKLQEENDSTSRDGSHSFNTENQNSQRKIPKKQNSSSSRGKTSSPSRSLEDEENRLLELERIATAQSNSLTSQNDQFSVTGTEEEFMLREIDRGNSSHLQHHHRQPQPHRKSQGSNSENMNSTERLSSSSRPGLHSSSSSLISSSFDHEVIQKLNEKISQKDQKIRQLSQTIEEKEREINKKDQKFQDLNKKFIEFRSEVYDEKDRLQAEHETEIMAMKELHMKQMSTFALSSNHNTSTMSHTSSPSKNGMSSSSGEGASTISMGTTALIEQLSHLRLENQKLSDKLIQNKKQFQQNQTQEIYQLETKYNEMIHSYKETIHELEDQGIQRKTENEKLSQNIQILKDELTQNEVIKSNYLNQQKKLENEIKQLQLTIQNSYKLETQQGLGMGLDANHAIAMNDLKNESRIRQLLNQIEFLKGQLSAELASVEEMKIIIENLKNKIEIIKINFQQKFQEFDEEKKIEKINFEQKMTTKYDLKCKEFNLLENKFQRLQIDYKEILTENEERRYSDEQEKKNYRQELEELRLLQLEHETLKRQLKETERNLGNSTNGSGSDRLGRGGGGEQDDATSMELMKHQHESLVRRIDNERSYLKSQLTSEILLKNELQNSLNLCQEKLIEIQKQWNDDVEILRTSHQQLEQESIVIEQKLQQNNTNLITKNDYLTQQLQELQTGYMKQRDLLRNEELKNETFEMKIKKLVTENNLLKEDIRIQQIEKEKMTENYQNEFEILKQNFSENCDEKNVLVTKLQQEISRQYLEMSEIQKESLIMKRSLNEEKYGVNKKFEGLRIYSSLTRWLQNFLGNVFHKWKRNTTLITATLQFKIKMKEFLQKQKDEMKKEQEYELHVCVKDKDEEMKEKLKQLTEEHETIVKKLTDENVKMEKKFSKEYEKKIVEELKKCDEKWKIEIEEIEKKYQEEKKEEEEKKKFQFQDLRSRYRDEMTQQKTFLEENFEEEKKKIQEKIIIEMTEKHEAQLQETEDHWYDQVKEKENEWKREREKLFENFDEKIEKSRHALQLIQQDEIEKMRKTHLFALEQLSKDHEIALAALNEQKILEFQQKLQQEQNEQNIIHEKHLNEMKLIYIQEKDEKILENNLHHELVLQQQLTEKTTELTELKNKMIKLEISKWQQILKETEKRYLLEIQQKQNKTYSEIDQKYQNEITSLSVENERQLHTVNEKYQEEIKIMKLENQQNLEQILNETEANFEKKVQEMEQKVRQEIKENSEKEKELFVKEMKEILLIECNEKIEKEQELYQKLSQEMKYLEQVKKEEKQRLQMLLDAHELRAQQSELKLHDMKESYEMKLQQCQDMADLQMKKLQQDFVVKAGHEKEDLIEQMKQEAEADYVSRLEREKVVMNHEMEIQLQQIQEDNDKLVTNLEILMKELQQEKIHLTNELDSVTSKLENTEDQLYDTQQEVNKEKKKFSYFQWKLLVKDFNYGNYLKKENEKKERHTAELISKIESESKHHLEEFVLLCYKLSSLVSANEKIRKKLEDTLVRYKKEELIELKTRIKLTEKEIQSVLAEYTMCDEEKLKLVSEIRDLENEIFELEEQSREMNTTNSSILTNGRINVSYTRKKKRIDTELERLLDLIEQKRGQCQKIEENLRNILNKKEEKEEEVMECERELMKILIEQQKRVLSEVEESEEIEQRGKMMMKVSNMSYPPPDNPTRADVELVVQAIQRS
jgi:hypothetical protein